MRVLMLILFGFAAGVLVDEDFQARPNLIVFTAAVAVVLVAGLWLWDRMPVDYTDVLGGDDE
jgi:hypothetical protein